MNYKYYYELQILLWIVNIIMIKLHLKKVLDLEIVDEISFPIFTDHDCQIACF